jgi:predicted ATPase
MIETIQMRGFKSFVDQRINFQQLTILTGLNSSGKSSVIQALLMAQQVATGSASLMLDGHGSLEEIKNPYSKGDDMLIRVEATNSMVLNIDVDLKKKSGKRFTLTSSASFTIPELIYVSANRFGPKSFVPVFNDGFKRNRLGPNGENLFQFIQSYEEQVVDERLVHSKSEGSNLLFNIRGWLETIAPNSRFAFKIDRSSDTSYALFNDHRAANVGFGLSYSLSVIAALLVGSLIPGSLVIIENPEAHLHPKGQVGIAKLIAACAEVGNSQIIIETHSDHVFDALRIEAKEKDGLHEKIQIHWFELDDQRNTMVASPHLNADGRLDDWPDGLFDQFEINSAKLI